MLRKQLLVARLCAGLLVLTVPNGALAQAGSRPSIEPRAEELLKAAMGHLALAPSFRFRAEMTRDVQLPSGVAVQHLGNLEMAVRRPDRLWYKLDGDAGQTTGWYDGARFSLYDVGKNSCASWTVKEKLDGLFTSMRESLGFQPPLARLLAEAVVDEALVKVTAGFSAGRSVVRGVACEHLVFRQENLDWQIWIAAEGDPVIRRLVFTNKSDPSLPQSGFTFLDWDFSTALNDSMFSFQAPQGVLQCEFQPTKQ